MALLAGHLRPELQGEHRQRLLLCQQLQEAAILPGVGRFQAGVRLPPGHPNKEIAAASANFHRTHFSKPYNIRLDNGNFAYTACFAFGVERLTYALLCQKGLDVSKWDEKTVQELKKYDIEL